MINENAVIKITKAGIKKVEIRSVLTCKSNNGVCQNVMDVTLQLVT